MTPRKGLRRRLSARRDGFRAARAETRVRLKSGDFRGTSQFTFNCSRGLRASCSSLGGNCWMEAKATPAPGSAQFFKPRHFPFPSAGEPRFCAVVSKENRSPINPRILLRDRASNNPSERYVLTFAFAFESYTCLPPIREVPYDTRGGRTGPLTVASAQILGLSYSHPNLLPQLQPLSIAVGLRVSPLSPRRLTPRR